MVKNKYLSKNFSSKFRLLANHLLTLCSNFFNNQQLADAHTCYKVFETKLFREISLQEDGFTFFPEITTKFHYKILKLKKFLSYYDREYSQGKKIKIVDGISALAAIIKYRFFNFIKK